MAVLRNMQPWKSGGVEPLIQHIERGQQLAGGIVPANLADGAGPGLAFPLIAALDGGDHEVVLALEMLVEGGLGDPGGGDDLIDADGGKAVAVEQIHRGGDEALAAGGRGIGQAE